ncbi:MAG: DUF4433 domain-containing protein [Chthonomonadales bacterium]|nr:DUF4433 domain-containing protein [Chthonomonadales bacterium]
MAGQAARYFSDPRDLDQIAWQLLRDRDFKRDADRPDKVERYQAEALAYRHVPAEALLGIACYNETVAQRLADMAGDAGASVRVSVKRDWYF